MFRRLRRGGRPVLWCGRLAGIFLCLTAASSAGAQDRTDYLGLRERLEASRTTLRGSMAKFVRAPDAAAFPDDKGGKVFRDYLKAGLEAVHAKTDFPEVHAALSKWNGRMGTANDTERRALGVFLGDYMAVRYGDDVLRELRELVKFRTYHDVISKNPDNPEFQAALDYLETLARNLGLAATKHGYETLEIRLDPAGQAAKTAPVAMFTHVEVMRPVEYKWDQDTPPFSLNLKEGRWIATGVYGDKGPVLVNLFALRVRRDAGLQLARPVVLLVGTSTSTPSSGIETSLAWLTPQPALVLAADGNFPYSEGQMGDMVARVSSSRGMKSTAGLEPEMYYIYKMACTYSLNAVPAETRTWVLYKDPVNSTNPSLDMVNKWRGIIEPHQETIPVSRYGTYVQEDTLHFFSYTVPSHVESPTGRNAIMDMASALAKVPMYVNSAWDIVHFIDEGFRSDPTGAAAGLHYEDPRMGSTWVHPVQFDRVGEEISVLVDIRFPTGHDRAWVRARMQELVDRFNKEQRSQLRLTWEGEGREPVSQSPPPAVRDWLVDAYELASGDVGAEPAPISRSSGSLVPQAIPFGPERMNVDKQGFTQHESISERELSDLGLAYVAALAWFGSRQSP